MAAHLYLIQTERLDGTLLPGVEMHASSPNGDWAGITNPCGQFAPSLAAGAYSVDFFLNGQKVGHRDWVLGDPPQSAIRVGLDVGGAIAPKAPRLYRGDMGVFIDGAPDVGAGGNPSLVLSFMYPRYPADARATIRAVWQARQSLDVLLSWQDDIAYGLTLAQCVTIRQELCADGFRPCEWMASKVYMPRDNAALTLQIMEPTLAAFLAADCISRYCVGGELDLWNTYDSLQAMTDAMAPRVNAIGRTLAVHFSTNRADWRPDHPGSTFAEYWNPNQGKLSGGLWFQADSDASDADLQAEMIPILQRFAGNFGVVPDSGFGHPFDCHAVEISLQKMFNEDMNQAECDRRGRVLLATPPQSGPAGAVSVMGSGNGE
jgi:hypothetical protein